MKTDTLAKISQPLKAVTSQDLFQLQETLVQLQSWEKTLDNFSLFFTTTTAPLNKKKIMGDFHATSQVFELFLKDFLKQTATLEQQIDVLQGRKKVILPSPLKL